MMATLLVVDDNASIRKLLAAVLGRAGHRVTEAGDGAEALERVRDDHPELVIADVLMPTMDGYELVRQIRDDPRIASIPVVFFTAVYHEQEARRLAESCGVRHVITKPAKPEAILSVVEAALGSPAQPSATIKAEEFTREHRRLLTDKLSQKAEELEIANLRLEALVEASRNLAAERDPEQLLQLVSAAGREIIGARLCIAGTRAPGTWSFHRVHTSGFDQPGGASLHEIPTNCGVLARLLGGESPIRLKDLAVDPIAQSLPAARSAERAFLGAAIRSSGVVSGVLCFVEKLGSEEFTDDDGRIAAALAAQTAVVWENIRRDEDLRRSAEQLRRLAADLRRTREEERARLAREVQERVGQQLAGLRSELKELRRDLEIGGAAREAVRRSAAMMDLVDRTVEAAQQISGALRPEMLDLGCLAAIEWHAREFQTRYGLRCTVKAEGEIGLDAERSVQVFRIMQEILTNVALHSGANAVRISVVEEEDTYVIETHDDGIGILPQEIADSKTMGLLAMHETARTIGGEIHITGELGRGTTVTLRVPRVAPDRAAGSRQ
ncbi:MAG: response regulator [Bryobacteraceae bacterium]|nr:response regulator [Bryobacteraceae bacterium]